MRNLRTVRRALLGLTTTAALASGSLVTTPAAAAGSDPHPRAVTATTWLTGELRSELPFTQWGGPSWGPTLDTFFALNDLGVRGRQQDRILDTLGQNVEQYVKDWQGNEVAGAMAKTLSAVQADGRDIQTYPGGLLERLEAQVETADPAQEGRVHEYYEYEGPQDAANSLDQAWAVRALAGADSVHEERVLQFLLRQQCENGGFRQDFGPAETCAPSVDTTALAVLSIAAARDAGVGLDPRVLTESLASAGRWLASAQGRNGSFSGVDVASSDSTGLAARALLALGRAKRADDAAEWLQRHQVTPRLARRTALRKSDVGALAPTTAALRQAKRKGIVADARISWRLATGQAAAGLDALIPG